MRLRNSDIDQAFEQFQFDVGLERVAAIESAATTAWETHLVWRHPKYGSLDRQTYLPAFDHQGRTLELAGLLIKQAAQVGKQLVAYAPQCQIKVSIRASQLIDQSIAISLPFTLRRAQLSPSNMIISIDPGTEDLRRMMEGLTYMKQSGVDLELNCNSHAQLEMHLNALQMFERIQIDSQSLIQIPFGQEQGGGHLYAKSLAALAHEGKFLTASNVNTAFAVHAAKQLKFDCVQGPAIGQGQPVESVIKSITPVSSAEETRSAEG